MSSAVPRVKAFGPDVIVAIGGGGFIPARMLRTECAVPILAVSLELYDDATKTARDTVELKQWFDEGSGFGTLVRGRRVLIVDVPAVETTSPVPAAADGVLLDVYEDADLPPAAAPGPSVVPPPPPVAAAGGAPDAAETSV